MTYRQLGDLRPLRAVESIWEADVGFFFKETARESWQPHFKWMCPDALDAKTLRLKMPMQSYIVQTRHHNILIVTCVGSNKKLPRFPEWNLNPHTRYIDSVAAHGLGFGDIDFVMCTHLHTDHCGWNTKLENGCWVPTFPDARYIFSKREYEHWAAIKNTVTTKTSCRWSKPAAPTWSRAISRSTSISGWSQRQATRRTMSACISSRRANMRW
jgi:hypothetical protein